MWCHSTSLLLVVYLLSRTLKFMSTKRCDFFHALLFSALFGLADSTGFILTATFISCLVDIYDTQIIVEKHLMGDNDCIWLASFVHQNSILFIRFLNTVLVLTLVYNALINILKHLAFVSNHSNIFKRLYFKLMLKHVSNNNFIKYV